MSSPMSLGDAITAAESAQQAYQSALTQTTNDQNVVDGIQTKLNTAQAQVVTDEQAQAMSATTYNNALDNLIAAAQAAKIPTNP